MSLPYRVLSAILLGLALAGCNRPSPTDPVHVGYLAPAGDSGRKGVQLAVKEANDANGLVAGRRLAVLAPDVGEGANAPSAVATRLISVNRVPALIGGSDGPQAEQLGRAAQPHNAL